MTATTATAREVIIVDAAVTDWKVLTAGVSPDIPVILLPQGGDGVLALAQALQGYGMLDAIHLVSHGATASLHLGDQVLNSTTLANHADALASIATHLTSDADVLLYGCSVAGGAQGQAFVDTLSSMLNGADIAASTNRTGPVSLGGDWDLEYSNGHIDTVLPFTVQGMQGIDHCLGCVNGLTTPNYSHSCTTGHHTTTPTPTLPAIASAAYDASTHVLTLAGTNFTSLSGSANDVLPSKLTITGEAGSYVLTSSSVEITSATSVSITLNTADQLAVGGLLNKNGATSSGGTTYNVSAAAGWMANSSSSSDTTNAITVSNVAAPTITSASVSFNDTEGNYLSITGTNFVSKVGSANDVVPAKFTLSGENGQSYTLTDSTSVELSGSTTAFSVSLSATDAAALELILNKAGTTSTGGSSFTLSAADDWMAGAASSTDIADSGNTVTVYGVSAPAITSATYDATTGVVVVTGTHFKQYLGSTGNDIVASKFTFTGQGGGTYTLTDTAGVDVTSATSFTMTLSSTDKAAVTALLNKNGTASTGGTTYNLAAAEDWAAGADSALTVADTTGNGVTVSNVPVAAPVITSATYDASTKVLTLTGTDFAATSGSANDVLATKLTLTGDNSATYTLTSSAVDITSSTSVAITLNSTDQLYVEGLLNKDGAASSGGATYNLSAAAGWMASSSSATDTSNAVTVSNTQTPTITSAILSYVEGQSLVVTGTNFVHKDGAANDVSASKFTIAGEGGATYTLTDSSDVDISSATGFVINLSATDAAALKLITNKDGATSTGGSTYTLSAAEDWMAGANASTVIADSGNAVTVSGVGTPAITSATYDASTGLLAVTGTDFTHLSGSANDIVASKFTLTGQGGTSYTLTDTASVDVTSGTSFTLSLSATDKAALLSVLNKDGTSSHGGTTYNLAAAEDWAAGADAAVTVVDATGNGITVSNVTEPAITGATYDAATNVLTVTGTGFTSASGNDINPSFLQLTGEGGSYTLTSSGVEITSATSFAITLSAADQFSVEGILNKNGTASSGGTTYNLSASAGWMSNAPATADTSNAVTVSNTQTPVITSATLTFGTNNFLAVTGTDFIRKVGSANDVDPTKFTITGEGGETYTLTDSPGRDISSTTSFTLSISNTDAAALKMIMNKDGTSSTGGATYNVAAAEGWMTAADPTNTIADTAGNAVTVSNTGTPAITSATYDAASGQLVVTGTNFKHLSGAANDIDATKFTFTGESGATYTVSGAANVDVTSGTAFTLSLSAADKLALEDLLNKNGTSSTGGATYNLAAAEDWAKGADSSVTVADLTGNGVTVSNAGVPYISGATYDASTKVLTVTGKYFTASSGDDIVPSKLTLTGEGGSYTLTAGGVEITSGTSFAVTLGADDQVNVEGLLNKDGTASSGGTTYNLSAAAGWIAAASSASDTANAVTVSHTQTPAITSASLDFSGFDLLMVTGTNFVHNAAGNDVDIAKLTITGEGGEAYTLTDSELRSQATSTGFTVTLSSTDAAALKMIMNKDGASSTGGATYNLAAAEDWMPGANPSATIADTTGNGITLSGTGAPAITSATYDAATGVVVVTGENFTHLTGSANDIVPSKFTFSGEGGGSYTLTTTSGVDVTSGTSFTMTLSAADIAGLEAVINKDGASSIGGATYNLAAAEDWAAGAAASVTVADLTGNGVTVSNAGLPSITSATYDAATHVLSVTGKYLVASSGDDIVVSKLSLTGEGGSYTLTSGGVEIGGNTGFTVTLNAADQAYVEGLLNKNGTASSGGTTYNLGAAAGWLPASSSASDSSNAVTVSNTQTPTITSATLDFTEGNILTVTGTHFVHKAGSANDVTAAKLTITGEGGATYTLTDSADADVFSTTGFTISLSATDAAALKMIVNQDGASSTGGTTYNIAAAEDWMAGANPASTIADASGNGVTVSGVGVPSITSAVYYASSGEVVVTGSNFTHLAGAANDIVPSKFTFSGEGGGTYTLSNTAGVEITSGTSFTLSLSAADIAGLEAVINKDGTSSIGGATYNLAAAEDWAAGAPSATVVADATNAVTVTNAGLPAISGATYDAATNVLSVSGKYFVGSSGDDVIVSKLALTGEGGSHTLTSSNVEVSSSSGFAVTLNAADQAYVEGLLNKNGTASSGGTTYNLTASAGWLPSSSSADDIINSVTVSNTQTPTITSATLDFSEGDWLTVTGTNFVHKAGGGDVTASKLTITGEGGATYTLTDSADVNVASTTSFSLSLSATDADALKMIVNKNGTASTGGTAYNVAAAEDWMAGANPASIIADTTGNGVTASGVGVPAITSATYDTATGRLTVTGANFTHAAGAANDIVASKLTFTGEGGETYTLTDTANTDITSSTSFTLTLSAADQAKLDPMLNKDGAASTGGTAYNLSAAEDWAAGAPAAIVVADAGNGVTVSNTPAPAITSASFSFNDNILRVAGTGFLKLAGAANDIDVTKLTIGAGQQTYTLTSSANVDIVSNHEFRVTLSGVDAAALENIFTAEGLHSAQNAAYNLAAAEHWAAGADAAVTTADLTGNAITVSNIPVPPVETPPVVTPPVVTPPVVVPPVVVPPVVPPMTPPTVDGVPVATQTVPDPVTGGSKQVVSVPIITDSRVDDSSSANITLADIPLNVGSGPVQAQLTVSLPTGTGMQADGNTTLLDNSAGLLDLIGRIQNKTTAGTDVRSSMTDGGTVFMGELGAGTRLASKTVVLDAAPDAQATTLKISGNSFSQPDGGGNATAIGLVLDASKLPAGSVIELNNVDFVAVIGQVTVRGGDGRNYVVGDDQPQVIFLGADDDKLFGGGGNDIIGSAGGNDYVDGGDGDDFVFGGIGDDTLLGGAGNDTVLGGRSDQGNWSFYLDSSGQLMARHNTLIVDKSGNETMAASSLDAHAPLLGFTGAGHDALQDLALLYGAAFGRTPDLAGLTYWAGQKMDLGQVATFLLQSPEWQALFKGTSNADFVRQLNVNMYGQAGADEASWIHELDIGLVTRAQVLQGMALDGTHYAAWVRAGQQLGSVNVASEQGWIQGSGNDRLSGGGGSNLLVGGDGIDTAVYSGKAADYKFTLNAAGQVQVVEKAHPGNVDVLMQMEKAEFADGAIDIGFTQAPAAQLKTVGMLYQLALDRAGDLPGVEYWLGAGVSPVQMAAGFVQSPEFQQRYGALDDTALITQLYRNAAGQAPADGVLQSWQAYLGTHTRAELVLAMAQDASLVGIQTGTEGLWIA